MTLKTLPQPALARPELPTPPSDTAPIYTRFGAAPQPRVPISEPRYIHALMIAAWLGRLIDPIDLAHQPSSGSRRTRSWAEDANAN
ncbi:hypothetical protein K2Z83_08870 [Oscillochloris sp. ZM17-4]|uniref:hypothetical protein n=1 Tax=Oscillochloris sp. ZM17-4 TaxID=2866714 RepID=UPI001C72A819|nr:hypothetical protein [Oscillochloris sp. ZM17-4]MBX0327787.1 hypothetical protein [Oscillochloris sp. ZM17-4]